MPSEVPPREPHLSISAMFDYTRLPLTPGQALDRAATSNLLILPNINQCRR